MALGPGKYDAFVTHIREQTNAEGVMLLVVGGDKGSGYSVQATLEVTMAAPRYLRDLADRLEADGGLIGASRHGAH
jgi:hypothetical protein